MLSLNLHCLGQGQVNGGGGMVRAPNLRAFGNGVLPPATVFCSKVCFQQEQAHGQCGGKHDELLGCYSNTEVRLRDRVSVSPRLEC